MENTENHTSARPRVLMLDFSPEEKKIQTKTLARLRYRARRSKARINEEESQIRHETDHLQGSPGSPRSATVSSQFHTSGASPVGTFEAGGSNQLPSQLA